MDAPPTHADDASGVRARARLEMRRIALGFLAGLLVLALMVAERARIPGPPDVARLPPEKPPPVLAPLPDFSRYGDVKEKKQRFFDYLLPVAEHRNDRIRQVRGFLQTVRDRIAHGVTLEARERDTLIELARYYRVELQGEPDLPVLEQLLQRADLIPPSLVLAQAAAESAWGTSRFARRANNLFGQWCFTEGCGLVPQRRPVGASHEVQRFDSVADAVASYFRNLNTHRAYRRVRQLRAEARDAGRPLRGAELAGGLQQYSERGQAYIDELRAIIRINGLGRLDAPGQDSGISLGD